VSRRYRVPAGQLVVTLMASGVFVLIGVSMLAQPRGTGPGGAAVAVLCVVIGCAVVVLRLTTDVTVTPAGISYRANFRRRAIPWASVGSLGVGPAPRGWKCIVVGVNQAGEVRIPVAGSRRYVQRVLGEIEAYRAGLGAGI
jgi:hypothetical protein